MGLSRRKNISKKRKPKQAKYSKRKYFVLPLFLLMGILLTSFQNCVGVQFAKLVTISVTSKADDGCSLDESWVGDLCEFNDGGGGGGDGFTCTVDSSGTGYSCQNVVDVPPPPPPPPNPPPPPPPEMPPQDPNNPCLVFTEQCKPPSEPPAPDPGSACPTAPSPLDKMRKTLDAVALAADAMKNNEICFDIFKGVVPDPAKYLTQMAQQNRIDPNGGCNPDAMAVSQYTDRYYGKMTLYDMSFVGHYDGKTCTTSTAQLATILLHELGHFLLVNQHKTEAEADYFDVLITAYCGTGDLTNLNQYTCN